MNHRAAFSTFRFDAVSGLVVAIVALPLALGFGVTSGAGAASGLVTAIVAGLIAALLGGSNYQVSGPTGAMVVVLFPIIAEVGMPGLLVAGALAGILIVLAGVARLGKFAEKIPWSVMEGFTLGIALVIALQQLPLILDVPRGEGTETLDVAWGTIVNAGLSPLHVWPLALVVATIAIKVAWTHARRTWPALRSIPPSGVAVVTLTFFVWLAAAPVTTIGTLPAGEIFTFAMTWPDLELATILYAAVVIAVLGAVESLLSARVADAMVRRRDGELPHAYSPDRELIGQGIATTIASLVGGMPATGAIARTAVNVNAGAKTRLSAVVHSLVLVIFVFALGKVVSLIPTAVLAGVLLGASWRIANPSSILENLRTTWPERIAYLTTAVGVVAIDLIWGTVLGIVAHAVATRIARRRDRH
jgi:SulP family sulfate permease